MSIIDIVFDGPPGPDGGRYVEVERDGRSINFGEWAVRGDGTWALQIDDISYENGAADETDNIVAWLREHGHHRLANSIAEKFGDKKVRR